MLYLIDMMGYQEEESHGSARARADRTFDALWGSKERGLVAKGMLKALRRRKGRQRLEMAINVK